jgi:hypothetical protein
VSVLPYAQQPNPPQLLAMRKTSISFTSDRKLSHLFRKNRVPCFRNTLRPHFQTSVTGTSSERKFE